MPPAGKGAAAASPSGDRPRPGALSALLAELVAAPAGAEAPSRWDALLAPGVTIGRFELVREVGRGGFGVVWEAKDTALGRTVAFKALRVGGAPAAQEERLLREAEAAARLAHPNIVTLHDLGRCEAGPYLVLELLRGRTLADRMAAGPFTVRESVRVAVEIAKGLAHAHGQGVVHRDLTPGNVYLCDDGQVKLLDLGMAHAFGRRKLDGGTPGWMAPEAERGAPEDERSDVFSLGAILQRMLSGEGPRRRGGPDVPACPPLGPLVARMVDPDPVRRPRDGGEVLAALSPLLAELSREPSRGDAPAPPRRRRARVAAAIALAAAAALAAVAVAPRAARWHTGEAPAPSVAVLPFADLSPSRDQEYFSDGVAEEILNALAQVSGLQVAGRTSSFAFRGGGDLGAIGRKLNVATVLEGSVRKAGNRVRITAQLVDVANGYHLWSETFERELTDVFAVQDEIARAVASALRVKLVPGQGAQAERRRTSPEAYQQYLVGRQMYARYSPDGLRAAVAALEKAVAIDPAYAPAWAALSIARFYVAEQEGAAAPDRRRALAAAEKAAALDPTLAEAFSARGYLRGAIDWDWAGAERDTERALALAPNDATTQRRYGLLQMTFGRDEKARAAFQRALELDPLFAANWVAYASWQKATGDLSGARASLRRALEIAPTYGGLRFDLALIQLREGDAKGALAEFRALDDAADRLMGEALAQHTLGDDAASRRALDQLVERYGAKKPTMIAGVLAWRGEIQQAFDWLNRAIDVRDAACFEALTHDPVARSLRGDPRYQAVLKRLRLPVD